MAKFRVTMTERGSDGIIRKLTQEAVCENRRQVIEWYGLKEPDIISYTIEEIN